MVGIQQPKIPAQLQEKNGPGPRRPCPPVLSISGGCYPVLVIHSCWVLPTRSVSPISTCVAFAISVSSNTRALFFFFNQHFKKIPPPFGTRGPPASRPAGASRVRGSCWAIPSRHCFPLCLYVSKGNCTAKALRAWNSAWGCFGYIKVFASVLPDLNGDFTSTELKRRGRRASPGEAASERRRERAERAREKGQRITSSLGLGSSGKDMTHSG